MSLPNTLDECIIQCALGILDKQRLMLSVYPKSGYINKFNEYYIVDVYRIRFDDPTLLFMTYSHGYSKFKMDLVSKFSEKYGEPIVLWSSLPSERLVYPTNFIIASDDLGFKLLWSNVEI